MSDQKAAEFAERENALKAQADAIAAREAEIAAREAKLKEKESAEQREAAVHFAEQLVNAGKILPRDKEGIVALQLTLGSTGPVSFAEGDGTVEKPAVEVLRGFLTNLPQQVDFAEKSGGNAATESALEFAAPAGARVDASRMELHQKAKAYQAAHPGTSYADAVKAVGG